MTSITLKPTNVASFPKGGGHLWVFMQYVDGLRQLGCDVYWVERFESLGSQRANDRAIERFRGRMNSFDLGDKSMLYLRSPDGSVEPLGPDQVLDKAVQSDLLLNFDYRIESGLLERFPLTAVVDIDPGLLQFWVSEGQLDLPEHDLSLTTGETVGSSPHFSDLGRTWIHFRPPISLRLWPYSFDPDTTNLTTVSSWWGGAGKGEWITDGNDVFFENNKRVTFLQMLEIPMRTDQPIELALSMGEGDEFLPERPGAFDQQRSVQNIPDDPTDYISDQTDRALLQQHGWLVRDASSVAGSPEQYQRYIQGSRGEFSCAKPSCMYFQNAWVSDRTLCYLASGKPVVVQDTGTSAFLPSNEGMFRFSDPDGALSAIEMINSDYENQCEAARALAQMEFDAPTVLTGLLEQVFKTA